LNWGLAPEGGPDDEAEAVYGGTDHRVLREHDLVAKTTDLCRKHGIGEATFYNWKSKFGGLDVSEARRLKQLEGENARLKKLLADSKLDNAALKDLLSKKW
jgi:putative transposase